MYLTIRLLRALARCGQLTSTTRSVQRPAEFLRQPTTSCRQPGCPQAWHRLVLGELRRTGGDFRTARRLHADGLALADRDRIEHAEQVLPNPRVRVPAFNDRSKVVLRAQPSECALRRAHLTAKRWRASSSR